MPTSPAPTPEKYEVKIPISLCLIGRNERRQLKAFDANVRSFLAHPDDEIIYVDTGSTDGSEKLARELGWQVHLHPELLDATLLDKVAQYLPADLVERWRKHNHIQGGILRSFAEARTLSFGYAKHPHVMWLDLDDLVINGANMRAAADELFDKGRSGALYMRYDYAHDEADGKCITTLWRERILTKDDFDWKGRCHETCIPNNRRRTYIGRDEGFPFYVKHNHPKQHEFSDLRNYVIMRHELEETAGDEDPRTIFYLANAARGLGLKSQALRLYQTFVKYSGSKEDIMAAHISSAYILASQGRRWSAMQAAFDAQRAIPDDPRTYYLLANLWFQVNHWKNCLLYLQIGDSLPPAPSFHAIDPTTQGFQPAAIGSVAARELGDVNMALEYAQRAYRERPNLPAAKRAWEDWQKWAGAEQYTAALQRVIAAAPDKQAVMRGAAWSPHVLRLGLGQAEDAVPRAAGSTRPTIAIWCSTSVEPWGPDPAKTGIGASEKMVVELAKRLAADFDVTVYCTLNCAEGTYDGVNWRWTARFNPTLYRDNLIVWRVPAMLEKLPVRAGRIYVWMHDVGWDGVWTPTVQGRTDKVLFLSKFQREIHPSLPESKIYYTRNGIDIARHLYDGREKQKKVIFCSSPDRGMQAAIRVFDASALARQGYQLHIFYGFEGTTWRTDAAQNGYAYIPELGHQARHLVYEDDCMTMAHETPGVVYRGRQTWNVMAEELKSAQLWLYPTKFNEISCVAAMEAMAAGCKLVATDHAALKETLAGYPGWMNLSTEHETVWGEMLRDHAAAPFDPAAGAEFARKFDLDPLAAQWAKDLFA